MLLTTKLQLKSLVWIINQNVLEVNLDMNLRIFYHLNGGNKLFIHWSISNRTDLNSRLDHVPDDLSLFTF